MEVEEGRLTWFHQINRPSAEMCTIWRNGGRIWRNGGWIWRNGSSGRPIEMVSPNWDESVELGGIEMEVGFGEMEVGEGRLNCLQD
ncbi:hypothetical protein SLEP1_g8758 [Rubroshorea leprosula]|uniref:Uncharacterized protein n=1 Tax=Rubroshorea leprosula TaxID=152421 RepID=A0AAV5IDP0_9ROSI|nr:hypothetical protein SLEP1_g8758 [Rubroshorea leprosula]